jgi:hypothetical protein
MVNLIDELIAHMGDQLPFRILAHAEIPFGIPADCQCPPGSHDLPVWAVLGEVTVPNPELGAAGDFVLTGIRFRHAMAISVFGPKKMTTVEILVTEHWAKTDWDTARAWWADMAQEIKEYE